MSPLILSALLSQFVPAAAPEINGALNALYSTTQDVRLGTRTITRNAARTRACIKFPGLGSAPGGSVTVRAGVVILTPSVQQALGLALPAGATTWADAPEMYAAMEVQGVPSTVLTANLAQILDLMDFIREEVETRASPVDATCEVGFIRSDDVTPLVRCACAISTACKLADGVTAAPIGVTLSQGAFTASAACKPKACVARFDGIGVDKTWPAACPK